MTKEKRYIFVGMVCVREQYQGQGYMRRVMELAFAEGNRLGVPVILETDAKSKCDRYIHLGMELARDTQLRRGRDAVRHDKISGGGEKIMLYSEKLKIFSAAHPSKYITVDGAQYRYVLGGKEDRKTLVFLNGGMNTLEMWMDYVDALAGDYHVLLFDYPQEKLTDQALVTGMHAFFKALRIEAPIFVGASGGMVAQIYVQKYPGEAGGMILISTGGMDEATLKNLEKEIPPCAGHAVVHEALQL